MTFGTFAMIGPAGIASTACCRMRTDCRISCDAHQVPVVGVAVQPGRNLEIELLIASYGCALRRSHFTPRARSTGPVTPSAMQSSALRMPTPLVRDHPDAIGGQQLFVFVELGRTELSQKFFTSSSKPS